MKIGNLLPKSRILIKQFQQKGPIVRWLTAVPAHFMVQTLELTNCFMTVRFSGGSVSALLTSAVIEFRPKIIIIRRYCNKVEKILKVAWILAYHLHLW